MTENTTERAKRSSARATVYRLTGVGKLTARVRDKYVEHDTFTSHEMTIGGARALLATCQIRSDHVRWAEGLAGYTGRELDLHNDNAAAVLLISLDDHVYALCYGMGHHMLDYTTVDPGFGLQYVARVAQPDDLRSVTRHRIDQRAHIDRRSIPSGGDVRAFDIAELGTVVSKAVGRRLGADGKAVTVRGADGLSVPLGRDAEDLVAELQQIAKTLHGPVSHPDLELLTRLTPIQPKHAKYKELNKCLDAALRGDDEEALLGTGWPWEQADEFGAADSVLIHAPGQDPIERSWLSIDDLTDIVRAHPNRDPLAVLRNTKVMLLDSADGAASPLIQAHKWIAFETRLDDKLYFFHDGRWFSVAQDYEQHVRTEAARILAARTTLSLPRWAKGVDEKDYNEAVAASDPGFLLLDRDLITTKTHPRGIEHCDLLGPDDEFIHVKRLRASPDASHLFAQVYSATDQLLNDAEGRGKLQEKISAKTGGTRTGPETPRTVVLAIGGRGKLDVDKLFTFSQVNLVRLGQYLDTRGVSLCIASLDA